MATTPRFGLHYQTLTDAPDGAALGALLAGDVDSWLARAYPVADAAARTGLAGLGVGFIVLQQDDESGWMWTGSSWLALGGSSAGGGGGGGTGSGAVGVEGQWRAAANQSLPNSTDTVLAFGTTETASALVTRATSGSGHKFTLSEDATYAVTATARIGAGAEGSRFIELRNSAQNARFVADGGQGGPAAATRSFSITKRFPAGQELVVVATQSSGGTLTTQYQGSSITDGFVRLTIVKVAD